jgi:hypothetical protein
MRVLGKARDAFSVIHAIGRLWVKVTYILKKSEEDSHRPYCSTRRAKEPDKNRSDERKTRERREKDEKKYTVQEYSVSTRQPKEPQWWEREEVYRSRPYIVQDEKKKTKDKTTFCSPVPCQSSIVEKEVTEEPEPEEEIVKRQSSIVERAKESSRVAPEAVEQKKRILFVLNIRRPDR